MSYVLPTEGVYKYYLRIFSLFKQMLQLKNRECLQEEDAKCIGNIVDLLFMRNTSFQLSKAEINCMIAFLCTN